MEIDYSEIQQQFNEVIAYSQNILEPQTDELFKNWYENKKFFIDRFGLIFEMPGVQTFELTSKDKKSLFYDFICKINYSRQHQSLCNFLEEYGPDTFFTNTIPHAYVFLNKTIPAGSKIIRSFKYFISDKEELRKLQDEASELIQKNKVSGKLCLSVHPLDFLSVSENSFNWRSCHALDGDYRAGNLSYMTDNSSIICYLRSEYKEEIPRFPFSWNSKKWRTMIYFSDDKNMAFLGRPYPFSSDSAYSKISEILRVAGFDGFYDWNDKKLHQFEHIDFDGNPLVPVKHALVPLRTLVKDAPKSLQFNDLLRSSCYDPFYSVRKNNWYRIMADDNCRFIIGHSVKCLHCGKEYVSEPSTMMCNDCECEYGDSDSDVFAFCPHCGRKFVFENGGYVYGSDEVWCPDCIENYSAICKSCDERYDIEDICEDGRCRNCHDWEGEF